MGTLVDLTGRRFGRLTVKSRAESRNGRTMWNCECDCGASVVVGGKDMKRGMTRSCGCYHKDKMHLPPVMSGENNPVYKHGDTGSKLYWVWASMVQRCTNKNNKGYCNYGGRGITVCDEWRNSYSAFMEWARSHGYREGLSIDRVDNDAGYSPENCRWADRTSQSNNRRCNILITRNGETRTLSEWAKIKGLSYKTALQRYYREGDSDNLLSGLRR